MKHFRTIVPPALRLSRIAAALLLAGAATQAAAFITINTVAGTGTGGFSGDGNLATTAELRGPRGVAVDRSGRLYISDSDNNAIRRVNLDGTIETIAGVPNGPACVFHYNGDNVAATSAHLGCPTDIKLDSQGNLYIADTENHRVRRVDGSTGTITTVAGTGTAGYDAAEEGGPATSAKIRRPFGLAIDTQDRVYFADANNMRVRRIETDGTLTTVAGNGGNVETGEGGLATSAAIGSPQGIALDTQDRLYITNWTTVRRVEADGTIHRVAGDGTGGIPVNGAQATASHMGPTGIMVDTSGRMYISDAAGNRIYRVGLDGAVTTVAGTTAGYDGDGGDATLAKMYFPYALVVGNKGLLYFPDYVNNSIRALTLDVPTEPMSASATPGNTQATVSWSAPTGDGGSPITGYVVTVVGDPSKSCTATPPNTSCTITGLTNGTAYTFAVRADNANGAGAEAEAGPVTPSAAPVPSAPLNPAAVAGNAQATVAWEAPASGGPFTLYTVTAVEDPSKTCTATPPNTSCTVTGLANGSTYTFKVSADNANGTGADSAASNAVTPAAPPVPSAPLNPAATAGSGQATVSWDAPASGGPFTLYTVTAVEDPSKTCTATPPATSCTVPGLNNGSTYTFTVRATNANGAGAASTVSNAVTPSAPPVPSAPLNPTATAGNAQATVSWSAPASGGPFTLYTVTAVEDPTKSCTAMPPATSCTITGLTNGTPYTFTVTASNASGTGAASAVSNAVTLQAPSSNPAPIPTLSEWALLALSTLMALAMAFTLRRQRQCKNNSC